MAKPTEVKTSSKVPEVKEEKKEVPIKTMIPEEKHPHKFVPLWMPITAFILILFAYLYCALMGIEVNSYRAGGAIGISGIFALACWYFDAKSE